MGSRTTTVLLVAVAVATVGVYVSIFAIDTTRDRQDTLDVEPVRGAASAACTRMRADLDALPALAPGAARPARLDRLAAQDRVVRGLITEVRAVGEAALAKDVPAEAWLTDWATLADARSAYAAAGAEGPFVAPVVTDSGRQEPITSRMGRIGVPSCVVPAALTTAP